jgi:hypothetical protein
VSDSAQLVCFDCQVSLRLGFFWNVPADGPRYLFDGQGRPSFSSADLNRAVWRMFADHVYHELRLVAEQSADLGRVDRGTFSFIGGPDDGDPSVADYVAGWPG